jgi:RND superfamily putative drug exporter
MLLLPALVSLFGTANWWMPDRAARLLRLPRPRGDEQPVPELAASGVRDA